MSDHGPPPPGGGTDRPGDAAPPPGPPPPGSPPPGSSPPSWAGDPGSAPTAPPDPVLLGAAHRPGAVPLRPLRLGDMFDAAFRILRFNPKATVGAAVVVASAAMAIPLVVSLLVGAVVGGPDLASPAPPSEDELLGFGASFASLLGGLLLLQLGTVLVTGIIAHVTHDAAFGRKLGLREAWQATRGRRWRLIGLSLLQGALTTLVLALYGGVVLGLATGGAGTATTVAVAVALGLLVVMPLLVLFYVRMAYLSPSVLVLERTGVVASLRRAAGLTRSQFWRVLGILLLTGLVVGVAGYVLALPLGIVGQVLAVVAPEQAVVVLVATQALSTVLTSAFTVPFTAAVSTLQYLDQRIRKEGYDVTLMDRAGITRA